MSSFLPVLLKCKWSTLQNEPGLTEREVNAITFHLLHPKLYIARSGYSSLKKRGTYGWGHDVIC